MKCLVALPVLFCLTATAGPPHFHGCASQLGRPADVQELHEIISEAQQRMHDEPGYFHIFIAAKAELIALEDARHAPTVEYDGRHWRMDEQEE